LCHIALRYCAVITVMFSYYSVSMHDMDNHNIGYSAAKSKKYPCISGTWRPRVGFGAHVCYHCRIRPPRFLAECRKRRLNQGSFVLLFFRLFTLSDLYLVSVCLFSCTALFVSISQVIGCEDHLRNDLLCVRWGVYSLTGTWRVITLYVLSSITCFT